MGSNLYSSPTNERLNYLPKKKTENSIKKINLAFALDSVLIWKFKKQQLCYNNQRQSIFFSNESILNTYGFRKIDPDRWEFANEGFLRGQRRLLRNIKRRKAPPQPFLPQQALGPCVELGRFGLDGGIDHSRHDKQVLVMELMKLKQQQQTTRAYLQLMEQRLQGTEKKQQQMMSFLARAMQNPTFLQQLVQQREKRKELEEAMTKKRRRPIDQGPSGVSGVGQSSQGGEGSNQIKLEPLEFGDYVFEESELEALAMEMQGFGRARKVQEEGNEELMPPESGDKELDEGFWEELFNETFEEELGILDAEGGCGHCLDRFFGSYDVCLKIVQKLLKLDKIFPSHGNLVLISLFPTAMGSQVMNTGEVRAKSKI
nr:heat stress transcription factor a-6b [Quercus suber]